MPLLSTSGAASAKGFGLTSAGLPPIYTVSYLTVAGGAGGGGAQAPGQGSGGGGGAGGLLSGIVQILHLLILHCYLLNHQIYVLHLLHHLQLLL